MTRDGKSEMRGFFPFGYAQGQDDRQKKRQKQIPCGNDKQGSGFPNRRDERRGRTIGEGEE
jgi:hypothetical protein